jgi:hypothetical protein
MISFFRKIRQQLLSQNKVSKYLLYAIGEIVLVVIGILIALQINNWNELQKLQEKETILLASFQKELEENITFLQLKVNFNDTIMANMQRFLELAEMEGVLEYNYTNHFRIFDYSPAIVNAPILEDILESDSGALVTRSELLPQLRALHSGYKAIEKGEYYLDEFWNDKITDYIIAAGAGHVIFSGMPEDGTSKDRKEKLLKINDQFLSLISIKKGLQQVWLIDQKKALERSKNVLQSLQDNPIVND